MRLRTMGRSVLPVVGAGVLFWSAAPVEGAGQRIEKHFAVTGRPVVVIQNVANGRIEVKSSKTNEVTVIATQASNKTSIDVEANFQLTVPEETELQLKTQTGLIYVEQVMGDMTLESVAGDVHLKEVSG